MEIIHVHIRLNRLRVNLKISLTNSINWWLVELLDLIDIYRKDSKDKRPCLPFEISGPRGALTLEVGVLLRRTPTLELLFSASAIFKIHANFGFM